MKDLLVRIGVDQAYGGWNAPVDAAGHFVYVPIPEDHGTSFHPGLERRFGEILPALHQFCQARDCDLYDDLRFPRKLLDRPMHLDPDFECLTYGDEGARRGAGMVAMVDGDLLVFYGGLRPIQDCDDNLVYALMGLYVVEEVVGVAAVPPERWYENAHVRKQKRGKSDIVVRAKPRVSGRFERCIPIGEYRSGAATCFSLVMNHPFVDGNKRIGHAAMETFLVLNGFELGADVDDAEQVILRLAAGQLTRDELLNWISSHIQRIPKSP